MVCEAWEFRCRSGGCVQSRARCDGVRQCDDGSDEKSCHKYTQLAGHNVGAQGVGDECGAGLFRCHSGQCIFSEWTCDHELDCEDGSDENDCPYNSHSRVQTTVVSTTTIAMVISIVCLIVILLSLASAYFLYRRRKRPQSPSTSAASVTPPSSEVAEHWPGLLYDLPPGALLREPPPRYTSRHNLSVTNRGFVSEHPGLSPPPYTPPGCPQPVFDFSMEPPPSYTLHDDMIYTRQATAHTVPGTAESAITGQRLGSSTIITADIVPAAHSEHNETSLQHTPPRRHHRGTHPDRASSPDVEICKDGVTPVSPSRPGGQGRNDSLQLPQGHSAQPQGHIKTDQLTRCMSLPSLSADHTGQHASTSSTSQQSNAQFKHHMSHESITAAENCKDLVENKVDLTNKTSHSVPNLEPTTSMQLHPHQYYADSAC